MLSASLIPAAFADVTKHVSADTSPKYVFFIVGDGMGASQRQIAQLYKRQTTGDQSAQLVMNTFPVVSLNITHSHDNTVTDSAAAGTALATGYKANNGSVAMLPNGNKPKSVLTAVQDKGWATGVISTDEITNATPGAFMAHNITRKNMDQIAEDIAKSKVDFIAGGGYGYFLPQNSKLQSERKDGKNLVTDLEGRGYNTFVGASDFAAFKNWKPGKNEKVFAGFSPEGMPFELDRAVTKSNVPSLAQITKKAITVLENHNKPFFLVVEEEGTDTASHRHDAHALIKSVLELDKAVAQAYNFYLKHPKETLIIVTADHETGGLGLGYAKKYGIKLDHLMKTKISSNYAFEHFTSKNLAEIKTFAEENFGLTDLTDKEEALLVEMIKKEQSKPNKVYGAGGKRPIAQAIANIVSTRAGVNWTSVKHTAEPVVLTAIGAGSEKFGGYLDNTQVAKNLADLLNVKLSQF